MTSHPLDADFRTLLELAEAEHYSDAVDHCFSVMDQADVDRAFWTLQIGLLYFLNYWNTGGLFEEAPRFLEKAVWLNPHSPDAHFWWGWVSQVSFSDTLLARREFGECLDLVPEHPYGHLAMAGTGLLPQEMLPHLEQVLRQQPTNYRALLMYADACERLNDLPRAVATLNALLDCRPYIESGFGIMNDYLNEVFNGSWRQDDLATEARLKLEELRPLLP